MKMICRKKHAKEMAITFATIGLTATAMGLLLQKPIPKISATLTGFGTAHLLLGGMYYLSQN